MNFRKSFYSAAIILLGTTAAARADENPCAGYTWTAKTISKQDSTDTLGYAPELAIDSNQKIKPELQVNLKFEGKRTVTLDFKKRNLCYSAEGLAIEIKGQKIQRKAAFKAASVCLSFDQNTNQLANQTITVTGTWSWEKESKKNSSPIFLVFSDDAAVELKSMTGAFQQCVQPRPLTLLVPKPTAGNAALG